MAHPAPTPQRIYLTVIHTIAFASTVFRLTDRYRMRRLWWDDYWAALTLVLDIAYFAMIWIPIDPADHVSVGYTTLSIVYQVMCLLLTSTFWSARISVVFSIIRILPPRTMMRRFTIGVAVFFGVAWIGLFIHKFWACGEPWRPGPPCHVIPSIGIAQLSADLVSDILLIGIPVRMLWHSKLPNKQRILILSIFTASIMMTCASIVHNISIIRDEIFRMVITGYFEAAISLIVCNLLVVVTCVYRRLRNGEELEVSTTENTSGPPLTTIVTDAPMTTVSLTDVSGMHTFDTDTGQNSFQDDSVTHGANFAARSNSAAIQSSSKTD